MMKLHTLFNSLVFSVLLVGLVMLTASCKKDDNGPTSTTPTPTPTIGITGPDVNISFASGAGATSRVITGGTPPYAITMPPSGAVATAVLSSGTNHDTLTITPIAAGTDSFQITDSAVPNVAGTGNSVIIHITVATGGGVGSYGSGTVTAISVAGNLSFTGAGVWPAGAGPSVIAVYDTVLHELVLLGYQQVSGSNYNFAELAILMPTGVAAGTYTENSGAASFVVGYNIDTSNTGTTEYEAVSGSIIVGAPSGTNVSGTYSGQAAIGGGTPIDFSGSFNVAYVRGRSPIGGAPNRVYGKVNEKSPAK